jgi:hypothetical protein
MPDCYFLFAFVADAEKQRVQAALPVTPELRGPVLVGGCRGSGAGGGWYGGGARGGRGVGF